MEKGNRAGVFKSQLDGEAKYLSFLPSNLPPQPPIVVNEEISNLIVASTKSITKLESASSLIPHVALFIPMYVCKEALLSSQIEGTQCTLEDVLDPNIDNNLNRDVEEVINYVKAINYAIDRLNELPLSNRLIKEIHSILMDGVRGENKSPGEFRISQNWIGGEGLSLKHARFIPPSPKDMIEAMSELEKYMNTPDSFNVLLKAALIHYQFETIHPFLDGNGRIGRLLVTLFLINEKVITTPSLYISYFLKRNRSEYYDRLTLVRNSGNYEQWIKFFLEAINEAATDGYKNIMILAKLHDENIAKINTLGRARTTALQLFSYLEKNPIIEIGRSAKDLNLSYNTVGSSVKRLVDLNILVQSAGNLRDRRFTYKEYLDVLKEGT
jgi:Fic family protein